MITIFINTFKFIMKKKKNKPTKSFVDQKKKSTKSFIKKISQKSS